MLCQFSQMVTCDCMSCLCYSNYQDEGITFKHDDKMTYRNSNLMDKWIVSFTQSLLAFVHQEMDRMLLH